IRLRDAALDRMPGDVGSGPSLNLIGAENRVASSDHSLLRLLFGSVSGRYTGLILVAVCVFDFPKDYRCSLLAFAHLSPQLLPVPVRCPVGRLVLPFRGLTPKRDRIDPTIVLLSGRVE